MEDKIYDIPFIARTEASDFACRDGEIESAENLIITDSAPSSSDGEEANAIPFGFQKDFKTEFPPVPDIRFALLRETLPGWHLNPDQYPSVQMECANPSLDNWGKMALQALSAFYDQASTANLFVAPFLVLAVWKSPEGNYISPSSPVLMIPNSEPILASTVGNTDSEELDVRIPSALCSLYHKITLPETLRDWVGKIDCLEILISDPLFRFDSSQAMIPARRQTASAFSLSLDSLSGSASERKVCTDTLTTVWKPQTIIDSLARLYQFHTFASFPLGELKTLASYQKTKPLFDSIETALKTEAMVPSYSPNSIVGAEGAIDFKGRKILWNPYKISPDYQPLNQVMCESSDSVLPRWVFHPDPDATEYHYTDRGGVGRKISLKRHPFLYGSYFDGGLSSNLDEFEVVATQDSTGNKTELEGYILDSEQDEPFAFTDKGLQNLAVGRIIALCRAFRSAGLVATVSPTLYVFSETGIYLFKENSSGIWSDAGLLARYVLKNPESILIYPQTISFVTVSGETVTIEGTKVKAVSSTEGSSSTITKVSVVGTGEDGTLTTRPLKLSGAGELKRVRKVFLRGYFDPMEITMTLLGSRDMRNWYILAVREHGSVLSLLGSPCRFYKVKIIGTLSPSSSLQGLSIETGVFALRAS